MKSEFFIDALEFLDDALLLEADAKRVNRKKIIYIRTLSAVAACIVLVLAAVLILGSPYKEGPKLLVGKDWRLLREGDLVLTTERPEPQYVVIVTETPEATEVVSTKKPVMETARPVVTDVPEENYVELPTPIPEVTGVPDESDNWTEYLAQNETESGDFYGVEQQFVMQMFASALNVEYVEPTATPIVTDTPVPTATVVPTPDSTEQAPIPTDEVWDTMEPTETILPAPPEATEEPTSNNDKNEKPPVTVRPESRPTSSSNSTWDYSVKYSGIAYKWQKRSVSGTYVQNNIGRVEMTGKSKDNVTKTTDVTVYNIKGVSEKAAVAIKADNLNGYYLFSNNNYVPATFKNFVTDYNLREYLKWDTLAVYGKNMVNTEISSEKVWSSLANADGKRVDAKSVYLNGKLAAALAMDIDLYGYENIPVAVYEEGYVVFSLFGQVHAFDIGRGGVYPIINYK